MLDETQARDRAGTVVPADQQDHTIQLAYRSVEKFVFTLLPPGDGVPLGGNVVLVDRASGSAELTIMPMIISLVSTMEVVENNQQQTWGWERRDVSEG